MAAFAADIEWYYLGAESENLGPFTLVEMAGFYGARSITDGTIVWHKDIKDETWASVEDVEGLKEELLLLHRLRPPEKKKLPVGGAHMPEYNDFGGGSFESGGAGKEEEDAGDSTKGVVLSYPEGSKTDLTAEVAEETTAVKVATSGDAPSTLIYDGGEENVDTACAIAATVRA